MRVAFLVDLVEQTGAHPSRLRLRPSAPGATTSVRYIRRFEIGSVALYTRTRRAPEGASRWRRDGRVRCLIGPAMQRPLDNSRHVDVMTGYAEFIRESKYALD
jgi:hypothetical protein